MLDFFFKLMDSVFASDCHFFRGGPGQRLRRGRGKQLDVPIGLPMSMAEAFADTLLFHGDRNPIVDKF